MTQSTIRYYQLNGVKPLSLNDAYLTQQGKPQKPFKQSWKNKTWRRKTDAAEEYQKEIKEIMGWTDYQIYQGLKLQVPPATDLLGVALTMVFFIPPKDLRTVDHLKYKGRDVSNYVKLIEDAIFEYLEIDDSWSLQPCPYKRISWDDDWHIYWMLTAEAHARGVIDHNGTWLDPYVAISREVA